jgi:hypothetical protein
MCVFVYSGDSSIFRWPLATTQAVINDVMGWLAGRVELFPSCITSHSVVFKKYYNF